MHVNNTFKASVLLNNEAQKPHWSSEKQFQAIYKFEQNYYYTTTLVQKLCFLEGRNLLDYIHCGCFMPNVVGIGPVVLELNLKVHCLQTDGDTR